MIPNNREFMGIARDHGLLVAGGGENRVRLLPPLTLSHEEATEAVARLARACDAVRAQVAQAA
jgi:acetylornithine/N-succinyldiaminopimelate aminotransferase